MVSLKVEEVLDKNKKINNIALKNAKVILDDAGIKENDEDYSLRLFEMRFKIYEHIKLCWNTKN